MKPASVARLLWAGSATLQGYVFSAQLERRVLYLGRLRNFAVFLLIVVIAAYVLRKYLARRKFQRQLWIDRICARKIMTVEYERRRTHRIAIPLPVRTTHPQLGNVTGATRDISLSGVYFYIESDLWKEGVSIEYVLQLPSELTQADAMTVLCTGKTLRVEHLDGKIVGLAVAIESFTPLDKRDR